MEEDRIDKPVTQQDLNIHDTSAFDDSMSARNLIEGNDMLQNGNDRNLSQEDIVEERDSHNKRTHNSDKFDLRAIQKGLRNLNT